MTGTDRAQSDKEEQEREFWRTVRDDGRLYSVESIVNKMTDCPGLLDAVAIHHALFERAGTILELGGGESWAACLLKRKFPGARILSSDISGEALAASPVYERIFGTRADALLACRSYEVPLADASVDLVFAFAAAHHFRAHRRTLREVFRLLRPGGVCVYLHEPSCPAWLYPIAVRRLNATRPEVPEDVLVAKDILRLGREAGFESSSRFDTSVAKRRPVEFLYYYLLMKRIPPLRHVLPCTRDFVFRKPA